MELWATWSSGRCPCPRQGGWNETTCKVPSTQTILWFYGSMNTRCEYRFYVFRPFVPIARAIWCALCHISNGTPALKYCLTLVLTHSPALDSPVFGSVDLTPALLSAVVGAGMNIPSPPSKRNSFCRIIWEWDKKGHLEKEMEWCQYAHVGAFASAIPLELRGAGWGAPWCLGEVLLFLTALILRTHLCCLAGSPDEAQTQAEAQCFSTCLREILGADGTLPVETLPWAGAGFQRVAVRQQWWEMLAEGCATTPSKEHQPVAGSGVQVPSGTRTPSPWADVSGRTAKPH